MEHLLNRATGYLVLEADIPMQGLLAGDQIYIDSDPQTTAHLIVGVWDDKAHICLRMPSDTLWDCCHACVAPAHAAVYGGALYLLRTITGYKEEAGSRGTR